MFYITGHNLLCMSFLHAVNCLFHLLLGLWIHIITKRLPVALYASLLSGRAVGRRLLRDLNEIRLCTACLAGQTVASAICFIDWKGSTRKRRPEKNETAETACL